MGQEGVDRLMAEFDMAYRRRRRRRTRRYGHLPWWALSLAVHVAVLIVLGTTRYHYEAEEPFTAHITVNLIPETVEPEEPEPPPPEPKPVDPETDLPEEPGPDRPAPSPEPGPDLPAEPTTDPGEPEPGEASAATPTAVITIQARERGYTRAMYAHRSRGGRSRAVGRRDGTTVHAERAVDAGLLWLARVQEADGRWACRKWRGRADFDVGVTGLALLALLGAGHTHQKGRFKTQVRRGLEWLEDHQDPDGRFAWTTFYEQGIATMAACEAFGLTRDLRLVDMAQSGLRHICKVQPEHGGFRYQGPVAERSGDLSVTGWQILALRSGICAELDVPDEALVRARAFLESVRRDDGGSAYLVSDSKSTASMTAAGMLSRLFVAGEGYEEDVHEAADYLVRHERRVRGAGKGKDRLVGDLYYTYYSTLAMYQIGGEHWAVWNRLFRDPLIRAQVRRRVDDRGRYVRGSWDPRNHHWGSGGGRVYTTAMAVMSLEVYYRYLPIYRN